MHMLKTALKALQLDREAIVQNVTSLAMDAIRMRQQATEKSPEHLQLEINRIQRKKEALLDSYFSQEISKADMQAMNRKYDLQLKDLLKRRNTAQQSPSKLSALQQSIEKELRDILNMEATSDVFCKNMVKSLRVFKDRHLELQLNELPHVFWFTDCL